MLLDKIKQNRRNHLQGNYNCIPFQNFSRMEQYIPGIMPSSYWLVTANSSVGKSKFTRALFVHHPVQWAIKNNKNVKVFFFSFEESKEKILISEMSRLLYMKHGVAKSSRQVMSMGRFNHISSEDLRNIEGLQGHLNTFQKYVRIYDNTYDPDKIYSIIRSYLHSTGHMKMKVANVYNDGVMTQEMVPDTYVPNDPDQHIIVVCDHIGLMHQNGKNTKQTIEYWSSNLSLKLRDLYGCTVVNVQQQASDQESIDNLRAGKLEPSLKGLAESKLTQRDANIVLGLYSPNRHDLLEYKNFNISLLKDSFRSLLILKDRDGDSNGKFPLYFDGRIDYFAEYPKSPQKMKKIYETFANKSYTNDQRQEFVKKLLK